MPDEYVLTSGKVHKLHTVEPIEARWPVKEHRNKQMIPIYFNSHYDLFVDRKDPKRLS